MKITEVKHAQTKQECRKCGAKIRPSRFEMQTVVDKRTGKKKRKRVRVLGDSYRWIKFNRRPKTIRCMRNECRFRPSDMTSSDKLSRIYAAQETAEDAADDWDPEEGTDALESIIEDLKNEIDEVAQEYQESADNIEAVFTGGSSTAEDCKEKSENLESWSSDLDSLDFNDWDGPGEDENLICTHCENPIVKNEEKSADREYDHDVEGEEGRKLDSDHEAEPAEQRNSNNETREEWADAQREIALDAIGNCPI